MNWPRTLYWWIDAVGGYLTVTTPVVRIGRAGGEAVDVPILSDLSSVHAELRRGESGMILVPHGETEVNGKSASGYLLRDGDRIRMRSVEMTYRQPLSWSSTARLEMKSRHRLPLAVDGVVLLGETCMLGPRTDAHIRTNWDGMVFVNRTRESYWIRCPGIVKIDGREFDGYGPLAPSSEVRGAWGAFRWEPATSDHAGANAHRRERGLR